MLNQWAINVGIQGYQFCHWTWLEHSHDGHLFGVNNEGEFARFRMQHNRLTRTTIVGDHLVLREICEP